MKTKNRQKSSRTTEYHHSYHQLQQNQQQQSPRPKTINLLNERSSILSNIKGNGTSSNPTRTTNLAISLDSFTNLLNNKKNDDDVLLITKQIYNNAMLQQQQHSTNNIHHSQHNASSSSPSSLGGRDVEPKPHINATTSHLRRFELEI